MFHTSYSLSLSVPLQPNQQSILLFFFVAFFLFPTFSPWNLFLKRNFLTKIQKNNSDKKLAPKSGWNVRMSFENDANYSLYCDGASVKDTILFLSLFWAYHVHLQSCAHSALHFTGVWCIIKPHSLKHTNTCMHKNIHIHRHVGCWLYSCDTVLFVNKNSKMCWLQCETSTSEPPASVYLELSWIWITNYPNWRDLYMEQLIVYRLKLFCLCFRFFFCKTQKCL